MTIIRYNDIITRCLTNAERTWIFIRGVAQLGDVCDRCLWQKKGAKRSGGDLPNGKMRSNVAEGLVTTGRALQRDVPERSQKQKQQNKIEVWLSLVERYVRDSITVLGVEFSRRAENP